MPFPAGIVTRPVTIGIPFGMADGEQYAMQVTFTPDRALIWAATGDPGVARSKTVLTAPGVSDTVSLPVTDQAGYRNHSGAVSVAGGAQAFLYKVTGEYQNGKNRKVADAFDPFLMALQAGDLSPIDLDLQVPFTGTTGPTVLIPSEPAGLSDATRESLKATYPMLRSTPPTDAQRAAGAVAYIDTSVVPPILKGWNGTTWTAVGGGTVTPVVTTVNNGDGTFTATGTGVVDNGDGTFTITDSSVTANADGTFTLAA